MKWELTTTIERISVNVAGDTMKFILARCLLDGHSADMSFRKRDWPCCFERFFEVDAVQSICVPMIKEIDYYSIYVFLDHNSPKIMDELFDCEFHFASLYSKDGFIYNYLEDEPDKVFGTIKIPIMIFNKGATNDNKRYRILR